ncbi:ShlB/FhaC/HecB family hemolysin secretion/activation protein [Dickeya undicola]|uniref:ShlB/FhaC/HecB family hemolysin secretion/activation protein n=1 Tax=Dickeya undicola TaxID=1577887 RepID=A0A3N0FQJ3_9GAMM|nr:ShlB/FhaC/HecB family hemolysin secretion/activation protein [Dickeya undicola]RNM02342.1 ShlB/FhaC/HecB family hemolysin secretion/activation protein [Dickeya undicola]RNM21098.1 ShlB/FhaC/HecB family hemolysin secretion/activation protein [Dickeya undicola]
MLIDFQGRRPNCACFSQFPLFLKLFFLLSFYFHFSASAAEPPAQQEQQSISQQERLRAQEKKLTPVTPDVRFQASLENVPGDRFPSEQPCFYIDRVELAGLDSFPSWLPLQPLADKSRGQCLGVKGINLLMSQLQNRLVEYGYVTSRVLAPAQDLKSGTLKLALVAGKVRHVVLTPDSDRYVQLYSALPAHEDNLLNLRDVEQGLENLQRLPTVKADMQIVPGEQPGESDVDISWKQSRHWRLAASLDDSGTRSTGRYQGGMTLFLDNPLSLSDMFYLSATHDLQWRSARSSQNYTAHYSVPWGYWLAGITTSGYDYHQTIAGINQEYRYSGRSQNFNASLRRVIHRNATQKTSVSYELLTRQTRNYINDTEVEVQRRNSAAWRLGLQHRHYIGQSTLDMAVSYQRGTRWFGALPAPEETFDEGTELSKILQWSSQLDVPFQLFSQPFSYSLQYQRQRSLTRLTAQEQFAIGNRWTVRGFDGERTLNADNGWLVRNELAWTTPLPGQSLYLGVDYGAVGGGGSDTLLGRNLAGGALGWRGAIKGVNYDVFAGIPLSKPDGFKTSPVTLGFTLNWQY